VKTFDRLIAANARAPFFLAQQLLPFFAEGGTIILVSSVLARAYVAALAAYAATKGAIGTLGKRFAAELSPRGIRVNAIASGVIETDMSSFACTDAGREFTLGVQALKRFGQPDDIGHVMTLLASDEAR